MSHYIRVKGIELVTPNSLLADNAPLASSHIIIGVFQIKMTIVHIVYHVSIILAQGFFRISEGGALTPAPREGAPACTVITDAS